MAELKSGERLGIYEIISQINKGGMSIAYKARVFGSYDPVVLKVVPRTRPPEYTFKKWDRRVKALKWEADVCNRIGRHPNIVRYNGHGKTDDWYFLGFDLVNGEDLEMMIENCTVPLKEAIPVKSAVGIMNKVAVGLQHIHDKGIIHKDIKCGNILVGNEDVKIIDFGLAYDLINVEKNPECESHIFLGTIEYAPPEYLQKQKFYPQGDIYSLGASLFHVLTGQTPFQRELEDNAFSVHFDYENHYILGPRLTSLAPHVSGDVQRVCLKALEKNPDNRFQSAKQFSDALNDVLKSL